MFKNRKHTKEKVLQTGGKARNIVCKGYSNDLMITGVVENEDIDMFLLNLCTKVLHADRYSL